MKAVYEFSAKCITSDGNKMTVTGELIDEDSDGWPPASVAEQARIFIEQKFPGVKFVADKVVHGLEVKGYPSVRKLKGKTKALQRKETS